MQVSIVGTGSMARGIATRLLAGGHAVQLIGRDKQKADRLAAKLASNGHQSPLVSAASTPEQLTGEVVILAVPYEAAQEIVRVWTEELDRRILVDITNPIDWDSFTLVTEPGTSAAEELAKAAPPGAKMVKAFNTTFAKTLVSGNVNGQTLDVFIAGDDPEARATVSRLAEDGGLRPIDVGPLQRAAALESFQLLHIGLQTPLGTEFGSAIKILA